MSECTEITGPNGTAMVSTVQDTPLTQRRHTVSIRRGRSVIPAAAFVRSPERGAVRIGAAEVRQGTYADALAYARDLVGAEEVADAAE